MLLPVVHSILSSHCRAVYTRTSQLLQSDGLRCHPWIPPQLAPTVRGGNAHWSSLTEQREGLFITAVQILHSHSTPLIRPCLATPEMSQNQNVFFLLPYFWYPRIQHLGYPPKWQDTQNPCSKLGRSNIWDLSIHIPGESLLLRNNMEQINTSAFI